MTQHLNLVILAGGASSRMKKPVKTDNPNITQEEIQKANERSKGLISVGVEGSSLLYYILLDAKKSGYKHIYIVIGEQGKLFREFYGSKGKDSNFNGLNVNLVVQYIPQDWEKPFGTEDALLQTVEQFPELKTAQYTAALSEPRTKTYLITN